MTKTIYIGDGKIWNKAKKRAEKEKKSLSQVIQEALKRYSQSEDVEKPFFIG